MSTLSWNEIRHRAIQFSKTFENASNENAEAQTFWNEFTLAVLDARKKHLDQGATLADLYDPLYMPPELLKAHHALDRAVDKCYRPQPFKTERERIEFLFERYQELTAPLG